MIWYHLIRRSRRGFTLVELIVVIAILAILAGIAIPVYSNYIKKANRAADEQLLAAVNTAYGAACLENGVDAKTARGTATLTGEEGEKKIDKVTSYFDADGSDFARYFHGNEDAAFKVFTRLIWKDGVFVSEEPSDYEDYYGNHVTYSQSDIDAYVRSNFYDIGVEETLTLVNNLAQMVMESVHPETGKGSIQSLKNDANFRAFMEENDLDPESNAQVSRGLVLYAADKLSALDPNEIAAAMSGDATQDINNMYMLISGKSSPSQASFSEKAVAAAVMYAMTVGYVESDYAPPGSELPSGNETTIASTMQLAGYLQSYYTSPGFRDYLASATAGEDAAGLIGVLRSVSDNKEVVVEYLSGNDWSYQDNWDMIDLINEIIGAP